MVALSILDLAYIGEGFTPADALANTLDLARHGEAAGFARFWLAEHHNLAGIASAATAVCICHVAGGTKTIRVGAGGIMLPNHSPMVIAEQFGTLATLFPGRIDLGLGRAPGTDQRTLRALRRGPESAEYFPQDVVELRTLLGPPLENQVLHAIPGEDTNVPLWILGSSLYGAQLAAMLGLPYAFASHFAPQALMQAVSLYRERFEPSAELSEPYVMGANMDMIDLSHDNRLVTTGPAIEVTKIAENPQILSGDAVTFTITITNAGDVLLEIDGEEPANAAEARRLLRGAAGIGAILRVQRGDLEATLHVQRETWLPD